MFPMSDNDPHKARQTYREEHNVAVEPHYRVAEAFERARLAYALTGFRAAYTMNAGAAVALPTFAEILNVNPGGSLATAVGLFVFGLILTFLANFLAYYSAENSSAASIDLSYVEARRVARNHGRSVDETEFESRKDRYERNNRMSGIQANLAAGLVGSAILCFIAGVAVASGVTNWMCEAIN
tara:strand:+ start:1597 stop:2145 length:549 start_codon:yes stop_codon:yes gene_type:complete